MSNLIDEIHYDHISMSKVLNIMDNEVQKIMTEGDPDFDLLEEGMRYLVSYSDVVHHPKEDALFDLLSDSDSKVNELIQEITQQHQELARLGNNLFEDIKAAVAGEFILKNKISQDGKTYIKYLRHHMNLEEGQLLRKARKLLSEDDMKEVAKNYDSYRDPLSSESLESEYNQLYRSLLN